MAMSANVLHMYRRVLVLLSFLVFSLESFVSWLFGFLLGVSCVVMWSSSGGLTWAGNFGLESNMRAKVFPCSIMISSFPSSWFG